MLVFFCQRIGRGNALHCPWTDLPRRGATYCARASACGWNNCDVTRLVIGVLRDAAPNVGAGRAIASPAARFPATTTAACVRSARSSGAGPILVGAVSTEVFQGL